MTHNPPSFGQVLKAWFRHNNFAQSVPEKLARERGNKTGPWASQISHAMNDKHEPKVPFFLALAWFNEQIATRHVAGLKDRRLVDQLRNAEPLCHANGVPYGASDFFSLYAGLIDPPEEFSQQDPDLTQEDVDEWARQVRGAFRQICLKHMVDRGEGWEMLRDRMLEIEEEAGNPARQPHDCLDWIQEVLAGLREPTLEESIRMAKRWEGTTPFQRAMEELLGAKKPTSTASEEERSIASETPFPLKLS